MIRPTFGPLPTRSEGIIRNWSSLVFVLGGRNGFARKRLLGAPQSQPLGVHFYDSGDTLGRHSDWHHRLLRSQGQRRTEIVRRDSVDYSRSATALERLFSDFQTAGAERGEHQYRVHDQ